MPILADASLIFQQQDKLLWLIILGVLGILGVLITYLRFPQRGGWKLAAASLKILGILLLLFCALEPLLARKQPKKGANIFLVVGDNSESLQIKDAGEETSRGEILREDLLKAEESGWMKDLNEEFKVHRFLFGERLQRVANFEALNFEDRSSSLYGALDDISQRYEDRPLAGIFVLTDGNANDLDDKLAKLPVEGIPLYPVNVAGESSTRDTSIGQVTMNQSAFEDAPVTINAEVNLSQVANEPIEVVVVDRKGNRIDSETVQTSEDETVETVSFQLRPDKEDALAFYELQVRQTKDDKPLEETEEATTKNNKQSVVAVMPHGPYPILYIAGRPDFSYKFFKRALAEDPELQLASLIRIAKREPKFQYKGREGESSNPLFRGFRGEQDIENYDQPVLIANKPKGFELEAEFPKNDEALFKYAAIIIDKVEADFFTFNQQERLQQFVSRRGGGFITFGGQEMFHKGGYDKTPIGEMLPVYIDRKAVSGTAGSGDVEFSREGWLQPWARLRKDRASEESRLSETPPVFTVNPVGTTKPGASLISYFKGSDGSEHPLLVTQSFGKGKSVAVTVGDLWRWGFSNPDQPEQMQDMNKFYRQLMRWIITDVPKRVSLESKIDSSQFPPKVQLEVTVNDDKFFPDSTSEVMIEVTDPDGQPSELRAALSSQKPGTYIAEYTAMNEGFYEAKAKVTDGSKEPIGDSITGWAVNSGLAELQNLSGNQALMQKLAEASGGEVVPKVELASFVEKLKEKPLPVMETKTSPLWHLPVFFLLALICFAGEWALKRWKGLP